MKDTAGCVIASIFILLAVMFLAFVVWYVMRAFNWG